MDQSRIAELVSALVDEMGVDAAVSVLEREGIGYYELCYLGLGHLAKDLGLDSDDEEE